MSKFNSRLRRLEERKINSKLEFMRKRVADKQKNLPRIMREYRDFFKTDESMKILVKDDPYWKCSPYLSSE